MRVELAGKMYELVVIEDDADNSCAGCAFDLPSRECGMPECDLDIALVCLDETAKGWKEVK